MRFASCLHNCFAHKNASDALMHGSSSTNEKNETSLCRTDIKKNVGAGGSEAIEAHHDTGASKRGTANPWVCCCGW